VRVVDLVQEQHFSEGEPDLEPPEELAIGELDDEAMLEEELDNEDIAEDEVDDEVLTATLEDLVHVDDDVEDVSGDGTGVRVPLGSGGLETVEQAEVLEVLDDLDIDEIEDLEESLDRLLAQRLAMDGDGDDAVAEMEEGDSEGAASSNGAGVTMGLHGLAELARPVVAGCGTSEFVCRGCFLVLNRTQLADAAEDLCRDCAS
jgi:hypothetical protein